MRKKSELQKVVDKYGQNAKDCVELLKNQLECSEEMAILIFKQQADLIEGKKKSS